MLFGLFEHIGAMDFEDVIPSYSLVETDSLMSMREIVINANSVEGKKGTYNIRVSIEDYKNANKIKIITVTIDYPISRKKTESLELKWRVIHEKRTRNNTYNFNNVYYINDICSCWNVSDNIIFLWQCK